MEGIRISGFADEISSDFDQQLSTVTRLGMSYISLRSANGKNVADYTPEEVEKDLLPRLKAAGVGVSSLGSLIGKIDIEDEDAFQDQLGKLERLCMTCKLLDCRYIRVFSFYIPEGQDPEQYRDKVIDRLKAFEAIARKYEVVLIQENEKDLYGETAGRALTILKTVDSSYLRAAFDYANFVQCGEDTVRAWEKLREYVVISILKTPCPAAMRTWSAVPARGASPSF